MKYTDFCMIDSQGRIVIPAKIRRILNLADRDILELSLADQEICIRKCQNTPPGDDKAFM